MHMHVCMRECMYASCFIHSIVILPTLFLPHTFGVLVTALGFLVLTCISTGDIQIRILLKKLTLRINHSQMDQYVRVFPNWEYPQYVISRDGVIYQKWSKLIQTW